MACVLQALNFIGCNCREISRMSETIRDPVLTLLFHHYALELIDMKLQTVDNCNRVLRTMTIAVMLAVPW